MVNEGVRLPKKGLGGASPVNGGWARWGLLVWVFSRRRCAGTGMARCLWLLPVVLLLPARSSGAPSAALHREELRPPDAELFLQEDSFVHPVTLPMPEWAKPAGAAEPDRLPSAAAPASSVASQDAHSAAVATTDTAVGPERTGAVAAGAIAPVALHAPPAQQQEARPPMPEAFGAPESAHVPPAQEYVARTVGGAARWNAPVGAPGRPGCNTTLELRMDGCTGALHVTWINLRARADRDAAMRAQLSLATSPAMDPHQLVGSQNRFEAIDPSCPPPVDEASFEADGYPPCQLPARAAITSAWAHSKETDHVRPLPDSNAPSAASTAAASTAAASTAAASTAAA